MKNLKLFGLAAVAAMALMAFAAGSASATALYSGSTKLGAGSTIDFSIPATKFAVFLDTAGEELGSCTTSTIKAKLTSETTGSIEELTWGNPCVPPTKTISAGKLEVVWTGGTGGTLKADSTIEFTINTAFFGTCIYGLTAGESIGTLSGNPASLTILTVTEKFSGSNLACPATGKWTGKYSSTEPANLHVEQN